MGQSKNRPLVPTDIQDLLSYIAGKTVEEVEKEYNPLEISKLASNENRLGCSPNVKPQVLTAIQEIQDYLDLASLQLREVLADENDGNAENVIVGAGSESLIANLCRTFFLNSEEAIEEGSLSI